MLANLFRLDQRKLLMNLSYKKYFTWMSLWTVGALIFTGICPASEPVKMVSDPTISPDGKQIAFTWRDDVWTASIDGGQISRLTTDDGRDSQPHFSPDGKQIAFISDRTGSDQIYVVSVDEGTPTQITYHTEGYSLHDWFPDGKHLLASGNRDHHWRGAERLLKVAVEKRSADVVLADATATDASLDRKGTRVLFVREGERWWRKGYQGERAAQVWMLDLATKEMTELLHEGVDCRWPVWHRSGKFFYFTKGDASGFGLWKYQFSEEDGGEPTITEVADFEDDSIVFPSISRNNQTLLFRHLFDLYKLNPKEDVPVKIELVYDGDPTIHQDELRREFNEASEVAFSNDGLEAIFVAGGDLWAMDTELREPIQLTQTAAHESSVVFGAEEDSLFTVAKKNGQVDIYKLERKEQEGYWWQPSELVWTQITNDPTVESDLRLSPDGKHLFCVRGLGQLVRISLDDPSKVIEITKSFSSPDYDISRCGYWVAYAESDNDFNSEIWIARTDGSQPPVNVSQHPDDDYSPRFSPDGKLLAFTGQRIDTERDIYYVWLQSEESERTSRERKLKEAIEKMESKRKSSGKNNAAKASKTAADDKESKGDKPEEKADKDDSESTGEGADEEKESDGESDAEMTVIDFDRIEDRVRSISIRDSSEGNLFWSPDGEKLAFTASIDGERGTYTVTFPDELRPSKLTSETIGQAKWSKEAGAILGHISGVPAHVEASGKVKKFPFTARQIISREERFRDGFEEAWAVMRDRWYDPKHANRNWADVRRKFIEIAGMAGDESTFGQIIELMLGELNGSHNGFYPSRNRSDDTEGWRDTTAHLGVRFDPSHAGPGLLVRDVLPGGPADRVESRLQAGDIIISIDGKAVDPGMDLTEILNGRLDRDIELLVNRTDGDATIEQRIAIRPISFGAARSLLYDQWLISNREKVAEASDGKLGYLHIRAMNMDSFYDFERELYRVGYGRDGLIIDVRDNGGGSTTDLLLTALTQPRHAITVPRDGGQGYPQSRMVYAVWQKPIVVLCNQNSYSNAEIFSHAIKNLKRGKLIGVETAGGVISTGSVRITDVGTMRMPFRGWFLVTDGEDMEMNGAKPDHVIWPAPGEIPTGVDRQLDKAIEVLEQELAANPAKDPELIYASEREVGERSETGNQ